MYIKLAFKQSSSVFWDDYRNGCPWYDEESDSCCATDWSCQQHSCGPFHWVDSLIYELKNHQ